MEDFVKWCISNKEGLVILYFALVGVASAVVKLIPPLPDGHWALPIVKLLGKWIALNKTVRAEDRPVN